MSIFSFLRKLDNYDEDRIVFKISEAK